MRAVNHVDRMPYNAELNKRLRGNFIRSNTDPTSDLSLFTSIGLKKPWLQKSKLFFHRFDIQNALLEGQITQGRVNLGTGTGKILCPNRLEIYFDL